MLEAERGSFYEATAEPHLVPGADAASPDPRDALLHTLAIPHGLQDLLGPLEDRAVLRFIRGHVPGGSGVVHATGITGFAGYGGCCPLHHRRLGRGGALLLAHHGCVYLFLDAMLHDRADKFRHRSGQSAGNHRRAHQSRHKDHQPRQAPTIRPTASTAMMTRSNIIAASMRFPHFKSPVFLSQGRYSEACSLPRSTAEPSLRSSTSRVSPVFSKRAYSVMSDV